MASKSDVLEKKILDVVLGAVAYTSPVTVWCALYTAAPTDAGAGTEVSGNGYARVSITNNVTNWPAATGTTATKSNGTVITFPADITANWGAIVAFGIHDSATLDQLLYWGLVTPNVTVNVGTTPSFAVNALTITED